MNLAMPESMIESFPAVIGDATEGSRVTG
jgi:hypothetical protein